MRSVVRSVSACVVVLAAGMVVAAIPAGASHYRFPASGLVTDVEQTALASAKVNTTLAFMRAAASVKARTALAGRTGISVVRLEKLSCQVDLLRVDGVGPSMVKLLQASGSIHTGVLRTQTGDGLYAQLESVNKTRNMVPVLPSAVTLADWVRQAKRLKQTLELPKAPSAPAPPTPTTDE
jgi:hypothetical protein